MADEVEKVHGESALGILSTALEKQSELGRRIVEAKNKPTAEEIEKSLSLICADIVAYVNEWVKIGKRAAFGEGCVLAWVEKSWDDLEPMHSQYSSFDDFAKQETSEEYSTYRAKIAIYRVFLLNEYRVPKIDEIGAARFLDVPVGKLQKAVAKAKRNQMDDEQWDALLDNNVNDAAFRRILLREGEGEGGGEVLQLTEPYTVLDAQTGDLVFFGPQKEDANGIGVVIGKLDVRVKSDEAKDEIERIISAADIRRRS